MIEIWKREGKNLSRILPLWYSHSLLIYHCAFSIFSYLNNFLKSFNCTIQTILYALNVHLICQTFLMLLSFHNLIIEASQFKASRKLNNYIKKAADKGTIVSSKIFLKQILNMLTLLNVDGESMYVNTIVISNL